MLDGQLELLREAFAHVRRKRQVQRQIRRPGRRQRACELHVHDVRVAAFGVVALIRDFAEGQRHFAAAACGGSRAAVRAAIQDSHDELPGRHSP